MSPHCDLDLEDSKQSFPMTLWPMVMHHNTKFGYNRLSSWKVMVQMKIQVSMQFLTFAVTLNLSTTQQCNLFMRQSSLWWCAIKPKFVAKGSVFQKIQQKVIFWLFEPSLWPWLWRQQSNLFAWHSGSWWCITIPSLMITIQQFGRSRPDEHSLTFWSFFATLTLNTTIHFFTRQSGFW